MIKAQAKPGIIYQQADTTITITDVAAGSINVKLGHKSALSMANILKIRAFNAAGQALTNSYSFSSSHNIQQSFNGTASYFELYIAQSFSEQRQLLTASKQQLFDAIPLIAIYLQQKHL